MDTKLCRICGKLGPNYVNLFNVEGFKNKIETCLPIVVSEHSLLPDTICNECLENVNNFYSFIKNCLQNIIILEAQYDITTESCLKTKRKLEKGCQTDLSRRNIEVQTDDLLDLLLEKNSQDYKFNFPLTTFADQKFENASIPLVDYEINSNNDSEDEEHTGTHTQNCAIKKEKVDSEKSIIEEINERKRKCDFIENNPTKICKFDSSNRRKSKQPKKLEKSGNDLEENPCFELLPVKVENDFNELRSSLHDQQEIEKSFATQLFQTCLLCETQFSSPTILANHVFECHGIDMAQILSIDNSEKRKKLPNLLKISDLKRSDSTEENLCPIEESTNPNELLHKCPHCSLKIRLKTDLYSHINSEHCKQSGLLCGNCFYQAASPANLKKHMEACRTQATPRTKFTCTVCEYGEENFKILENHVLLHEYLLDECKREFRMFDPAYYIVENHLENESQSSLSKTLQCTECNENNLSSFREFSEHRRSVHSIFHCDLCNKFYGRNSHLWKHVNRLHKGHPSITCQLCYKTSASKYHLMQHFNKIHSIKPQKLTNGGGANLDFMNQKFEPFDFQSVKQSFMREKMNQIDLKVEDINNFEENTSSSKTDDDIDNDKAIKIENAPKEIDLSSNLYTNIITNYTPPPNEGAFKCPKCTKAFHKKTLLKKHKKNCRPRLQKDLLTRCKSCARIFKDRQSLAKHLINYHSVYECEICAQKVQSKCEIVAHIRFTHQKCHLFCKLCGNILRNLADLTEHVKNHAESYVCQFCADLLPSKIKLKMHILSLHRKILSLSCGICLKLFETQHILRDHVTLVHKSELKPCVSCTVCGKNYGSKWKTFDHINKSHGRIFKACKICLEVFDTELELQEHSTTHVMPQKTTVSNVITTLSNVMPENLIESDTETSSSDNDANKKVSLLEKRLTCSKTDTKPPVFDFLDSKPNNVAKIIENEHKPIKIEPKTPKVTSKSTKLDSKVLNPVKIKAELKSEDDYTHNVSHTSKRTVYVNSDTPSVCEICYKTWPAKKHLWQHYIRCHKNVAATVCGICLKTNPDYASLQRHLMLNHPTLLHGQGFGSNFICRICGRYHNASSKLKLHMVIHENFDWSLLENGSISVKSEVIKQEINYDSLIEQVECSSESESDSEEPQNNVPKSSSYETDSSTAKNASSSSSSSETNENTSDDDTAHASERDVIQDADSNLFRPDVLLQSTEVGHEFDHNGIVLNERDDAFIEQTDSFQDGGQLSADSRVSNSTNGAFSMQENDSNSSNGSVLLGNVLKSDKLLDSAIKSITYDYEADIKTEIVDDYCDLQMQNLNDNELESAVGSIL